MGRTCKRVPLDFSWPMKTLWIGYVNPYKGVDCPYCDRGYSEKAQEIIAEVYPWKKGDETYAPNPYKPNTTYNPHAKEHHMTQDEVDHSEKEGWDSSCPHCKGEGVLFLNDEIKRLHEEFRWVEPPTGEGYQMWEDTSEGSPISPVFKTAEELAEYCEREGVSWFGARKAKKEDWLRVINDSAPATVQIAPGVIMM